MVTSDNPKIPTPGVFDCLSLFNPLKVNEKGEYLFFWQVQNSSLNTEKRSLLIYSILKYKPFVAVFLTIYIVLYSAPFPIGAIVPPLGIGSLLNQLWFTIGNLFEPNIVPPIQSHQEIEVTGDSFYHYSKCLFLFVISFFGTTALYGLGLKKVYKPMITYGHVYARLFLGYLLIYYGIAKVFPAQFTELSVLQLHQPLGEMSPMSLLWSFMNYSRHYSLFTGIVECVAGIFVVLPFSYGLGALISSGAMLNVFLLNLFYDVPVKLLSFHMLGISLVLLGPFLPKLANALLSTNFHISANCIDRFAKKKVMLGHQILVLFLVFSIEYQSIQEIIEIKKSWRKDSEFYGVWNTQDPQSRFVKFIFHRKNQMSVFSRDGRVYRLRIKKNKNSRFSVTDLTSYKTSGDITLIKKDENRLSISGQIEDFQLSVTTTKAPTREFPLLKEKFKWIQEHAFLR